MIAALIQKPDGFDATSQAYRSYQQNSGSLTRLQGQQVYWLHMASASQWQVSGKRSPLVKALHAGWNQSVLPISAPVATADYVKNNPLSSIWYFSQAEQRWYYWVKGQGGSLAQLQPGQIYWLLSPRAQTLAQDYGLRGEIYFQHSDHLGSVLLETRSDGSVNQRSPSPE